MAKRLIDTSIWTQNKWFRKLKPEYKLLWIYLFCNCDAVGVWEEDFELASFIVGFDFDKVKANEAFEGKIKWINGKKLWIIDFCNFQYGELKEENITNKPHQSYIALLKKHSLWIDYTKTIHSHKEKDKEKEKEKDNKGGYGGNEIFEQFRLDYPGTKRGFEVEFENFKKKHKDWQEVLLLLQKRLDYQKDARQVRKENKLFVPEWKNLQTWINQRCWEDIINTNE